MRWKQEGEKTDGPKTQNLPTISELFVQAAPRLDVLASDSPYADNRQTAPQIRTREKERMNPIFKEMFS